MLSDYLVHMARYRQQRQQRQQRRPTRAFDPTGNGAARAIQAPQNNWPVPVPIAAKWLPYYIGAGHRGGWRVEVSATSEDPDVLSQDLKSAPDIIRLDAHGSRSILRLKPGDRLTCFFSDRPSKTFAVKALYSFEVPMDPTKTAKWFYERHAPYRSLSNGSMHSVPELHRFFFEQPGERLVLTTCIDDPSPAWGRRFFVAEPSD